MSPAADHTQTAAVIHAQQSHTAAPQQISIHSAPSVCTSHGTHLTQYPVTATLSYTDTHSVSTVQSTGVVTRQQARAKAYTKPQAQCIPAPDFMNERPTATTTTSSTTTQPLPSMPLSQHDLRLPTTPTSQYDLGLPMPCTSSRTNRPVAMLDLSLSAIDEPYVYTSASAYTYPVTFCLE